MPLQKGLTCVILKGTIVCHPKKDYMVSSQKVDIVGHPKRDVQYVKPKGNIGCQPKRYYSMSTQKEKGFVSLKVPVMCQFIMKNKPFLYYI